MTYPVTTKAYDVEVNGICYNLDTNERTAAVTSKGESDSYSGDVIIPASFSFDGVTYSVTSIDENCFYRNSSLTSISIPNSVSSIRYRAFFGCSSLTSLYIPNSLTNIWDDAFAFCSGLTSISVASDNPVYDSRNNCNAIIETASNSLIVGCQNSVIPISVTRIGDWAFCGCTGLKSITISSNITSIGHTSFSDCSGLTSIFVESDNAFYDSRGNCNAIIATADNELITGCQNTIIPNSVTSIGNSAFSSCFALTSVIIPNSVTRIGSSAFCNCNNLTSVTIGNSVSTIEHSAFRYCYGLTSVTIPHSVTSIDIATFGECFNLTSMILENPVPFHVDDLFLNRSNTTLFVPIGSKSAYKVAAYWKDFKSIVEMDNTCQLSVNPVTIRSGKTSTVSIGLDNEKTLIAFEFYLQLPDGIRITEDADGYPDVTLSSERSNRHILEVDNEGNGLYHFLCYSNKNNSLKGNSGEILNFEVTCDEGVEARTYHQTIHTIKFADVNENPVYLVDCQFSVEVFNYVIGDVNDDDDIDVMDVVAMVSYIMGWNPSHFNFAAADHTGDGIIDVIDLVRQVSLVMSQPISYTPEYHSFDALGSGLSLVSDSDGAIHVSLNDGQKYVATQFIVSLSEGQQLVDVTTDREHSVSIEPMSDNRFFVMSYSSDNTAFATNDETLTLQVTGNGTVAVEGAAFVDTDSKKVLFQDASSVTTGIKETSVNFSSPTDIYYTNGMLVKKNSTTTDELRRGVYIINGKKQFIK